MLDGSRQFLHTAIGEAVRRTRAVATFAICTLSAVSVPDVLNLNKVKAKPATDYRNEAPNYRDADCRSLVSGTYLTTLSQDGTTASRAIITLTQDGNIFVVDSNQGGVPGAFNPFGDSQGAWKCTGNREITATTLNFSYPGSEGPGSLARQNFRVTFDPSTGAVQGTLTRRFFNLNANPLEDDAPVGGTFNLTGQRVTAE